LRDSLTTQIGIAMKSHNKHVVAGLLAAVVGLASVSPAMASVSSKDKKPKTSASASKKVTKKAVKKVSKKGSKKGSKKVAKAAKKAKK